MQREPSAESPTLDRRVRRSRSALMAAAVRLVSERGTTSIPATDLTEAADVSRKVLYLHFGDRDALLVAAAVELVERELLPEVGESLEDLPAQLLTLARHFARRRSFYRAMLTGSCAYAMTETLNELFGSLNQNTVRQLFGQLERSKVEDVALFLAGGGSAIVNDWLIHAEDPVEPEELASRLLGVASVLAPATTTPREAVLDESGQSPHPAPAAPSPTADPRSGDPARP